MRWIFATIFFWLTFVLSLAGWWLYFGVSILGRGQEQSELLARQQRMLMMEGGVLMLSLFIGGVALFYFSYRMYKEKSAKDIFFASFTHDMKTGLFRLQLEIEKLAKNTGGHQVEPLLTQTRKMQLDLENSLDSSLGLSKELFYETVNLKDFLSELHTQWPELGVQVKGEAQLPIDRRALFSVFRNLFHNSQLHGKADEVYLEVRQENDRISLVYRDNGSVFQGELDKLGRARYTTDGTGFGLFIVKQWIARLHGKIEFQLSPDSSLMVKIELPQRVRG